MECRFPDGRDALSDTCATWPDSTRGVVAGERAVCGAAASPLHRGTAEERPCLPEGGRHRGAIAGIATCRTASQSRNRTKPQPEALDRLLLPLRAGHDVGLLSEAGCPAVADPGANLVALAQQENIRVVPLIGPSSLLLALMACGLNGQRFAFHGYLPTKETERAKALREIESESRTRQQTQIWIETPYRNRQLFATILQVCHSASRLTLATDLTQPGESVATRTIRQWKNETPPAIERRPTVFLLLA